jgi:apolipoprotein N-acyltransferase
MSAATKKTKPKPRSKPAQKDAAPAAPRAPLGQRLLPYGIATFVGILLFTACAKLDLWWNAWFCFVPLLYLVDRAPSARSAAKISWWAGIVANCGGFYWIIALLERFAHLPWILAAFLFFLLASYQALVFLLFGGVLWKLRRTTSLPMTVLAPVVMVAFELCVPMIFPWYLAITQAWNIHVIQVADLTGPLGVSALLLVTNGAIFDLWQRRRAAWRPAAIAAATVALALAYGHLRIGQVDAARAAAPKINVGVVQPNVSFDMKGVNRPEFAEGQVRDLQACSAKLEERGADLVVWTESGFPYWVSRTMKHDLSELSRGRIRRGFSVPLFMGAVTDSPGDEYPHNSALMLERQRPGEEGGEFTARFDKIFLLMFGEYIPGLETFHFIKKLMPQAAGNFARGKEVLTFPFRRPSDPLDAPAPWRLGPLICYEDIIPKFGRNLAALHPHMLVNITNDAWFGASSEPWEHLQLAVYRSVELRTDMVRAVNTGVSAWIDGAGRLYHHTYSIDPKSMPLPPDRSTCGVSPESKADMEMAPMVLMEGGHTFYARFGDLFGYLMLALTAWWWLVAPWLSARRGSATPTS